MMFCANAGTAKNVQRQTGIRNLSLSMMSSPLFKGMSTRLFLPVFDHGRSANVLGLRTSSLNAVMPVSPPIPWILAGSLAEPLELCEDQFGTHLASRLGNYNP